MTKADFIRNNRGIDDGKDLSEDYLGSLYDHIVKNEIKMKPDPSAPQSKQGNSLNKLLGLDGILNLVWKQPEEKALGANGYLLKHIQEQFKAKSSKSEYDPVPLYSSLLDYFCIRYLLSRTITRLSSTWNRKRPKQYYQLNLFDAIGVNYNAML